MNLYSARYQFSDIVSVSNSMHEVKELAAKVAKSSSTVLVTGESGTGKELFAHAIHNLSSRSKNPFVCVNCAAIPEELFESEMFGYESGAFSGAKREGKPGKFELAHGGSIFLDEISELPWHMQGKLLRVLQEQEIERIGGVKTSRVNVRIIAATNLPLKPLIEGKRFRQDLFYRLRVFPIHIPSLRSRTEDIPALVNHFLKAASKRLGLRRVQCDSEVSKWLVNYQWPGNVRELNNWVEAAIQLADGYVITMKVVEMLRRSEPSIENRPFASLKDEMERTEKRVIERALQASHGDRMLAAERLGIHHTSLYRKISKYGLK